VSGNLPVCIYIYVYICVCVRVCACVCDYFRFVVYFILLRGRNDKKTDM